MMSEHGWVLKYTMLILASAVGASRICSQYNVTCRMYHGAEYDHREWWDLFSIALKGFIMPVSFLNASFLNACRASIAIVYGVPAATLRGVIQYYTMSTTMVGFIILSSHIAIYCKYSADICVPMIHI